MQLQLCSVFFTFSLGTRTHYFGRTILHGGAKVSEFLAVVCDKFYNLVFRNFYLVLNIFSVSSYWKRFCCSSHQVCRELSTLLEKSFREGVSDIVFDINTLLMLCVSGGEYMYLHVLSHIWTYIWLWQCKIFTGSVYIFQAGSSITSNCLPGIRLLRGRCCFLCSVNIKQLVSCHLLALCTIYIQSIWIWVAEVSYNRILKTGV